MAFVDLTHCWLRLIGPDYSVSGRGGGGGWGGSSGDHGVLTTGRLQV